MIHDNSHQHFITLTSYRCSFWRAIEKKIYDQQHMNAVVNQNILHMLSPPGTFVCTDRAEVLCTVQVLPILVTSIFCAQRDTTNNLFDATLCRHYVCEILFFLGCLKILFLFHSPFSKENAYYERNKKCKRKIRVFLQLQRMKLQRGVCKQPNIT